MLSDVAVVKLPVVVRERESLSTTRHDADAKFLLGDRRHLRAWLQRRRGAPSLCGDGVQRTFRVNYKLIGTPSYVHQRVGGLSSIFSRRRSQRLRLNPPNPSSLRTTSSTHFLAHLSPPSKRGARPSKSSRLVLSATHRTRSAIPM